MALVLCSLCNNGLIVNGRCDQCGGQRNEMTAILDEMERHADDEEDYWRRTGHRPPFALPPLRCGHGNDASLCPHQHFDGDIYATPDDPPPLVRGGQGRSADEIREDGNGIVFLAGMAAGAVLASIAWAVWA